MTNRIEGRLRSLERNAPVRQSHCPACQDWCCEVFVNDEPDPPMQCHSCGRRRLADLFVVRFRTRDDGPQ